MIMFWRRREVLLTYSLEERVRVCDALAANGIDYEVLVKEPVCTSVGQAGHAWDQYGCSDRIQNYGGQGQL